MAFEPIKRQSLSEAVFEQLRSEIVTGRMEPGTPLPPERALAEMLGVNRGAVREALKRLEQARLVSIQQGGVTRVLDYERSAGMDLLTELMLSADGRLSFPVARSVLEMRATLAPDIARLAARRADAELADELDRTLTEMKAAGQDLPELQRLAMVYWRLLVDGSANVAYKLAFNTLATTYDKIAGALTEALREELTHLAPYAALAEAVRTNDEAAARRRAADIVQRGHAGLTELLEKLEAATLEDTP